MSDKQDSQKKPAQIDSAEDADCCQGGYGYMKRRLGLLSNEADKIKDRKSKRDSKKL